MSDWRPQESSEASFLILGEEAEEAVAEAEANLAIENAAFVPEVDDETQSPRWATELTSAVRELASEVHHLHPPLTTETQRNHRLGKAKSKKRSKSGDNTL